MSRLSKGLGSRLYIKGNPVRSVPNSILSIAAGELAM